MKRLLFVYILLFAACADTLDDTSKTRTVILPGMPHLEWMTENLSGFGGTEVDGHWYYTWEEAMAAAEQLGDDWRLPTQEEFEALCDLGSTWDDKRKGRWFGGNHDTDHEGSLFMPAAGFCYYDTGAPASVGYNGYFWSSLFYDNRNNLAGELHFNASFVEPLEINKLYSGSSVRLVRSV